MGCKHWRLSRVGEEREENMLSCRQAESKELPRKLDHGFKSPVKVMN